MNRNKYTGMINGLIVGDMLAMKYKNSTTEEVKAILGSPESRIKLEYWDGSTAFFISTLHSLLQHNYNFNKSDILKRYKDIIEIGRYLIDGEVTSIKSKEVLSIKGTLYGHDTDNDHVSLMRILPMYVLNMDKEEMISNAREIYNMFGDIDNGIVEDLYDILKIINNSGTIKNIACELANTRHARVLEFNDDNILVNIESSTQLLRVALYCFMSTRSFRDAVIKALSIGYIVESLVPLTAFLAGFYYGHSEIPYEWSQHLTSNYMYIVQAHFSEMYSLPNTGLTYKEFTVNL